MGNRQQGEIVPTYHATATWDGMWWSVVFEDLPQGFGGATQGRDRMEAISMAREAVALLLDVGDDAFELEVKFADPAAMR